MKNRIQTYRIEDSIQLLNVLILGNLLLGVVLILPDFHILQSSRAQLCLFTALVYFAAKRFYDWRSGLTNVLLIIFYFMLLAIEFITLEVPGYPFDYHPDSYVSKGIFLDLLILALPGVYVCLRIFLVFPLFVLLKNMGRAGAT